jgi:hypothetical protein
VWQLTMRTAFDRFMIVASFSVSMLLASTNAGASSAIQQATKLHALIEDEWQWTLREYPEFATSVGDPRYNDKLTDVSASAMDRRKAHERDLLKRVMEIDHSSLTGQDVLSYDLFRRAAVTSAHVGKLVGPGIGSRRVGSAHHPQTLAGLGDGRMVGGAHPTGEYGDHQLPDMSRNLRFEINSGKDPNL